ncbi:MAG: hypothetical protein V4597_18380 [Pseudomonadota bacterium]
MASLPYRAGALLIPFNPKLHLFAILNDPCQDKQCLVVMVTTIYEGKKYDPSCVLKEGDHPFIERPSYLLYRMAETIRSAQIETRLGQKYYVAKPDFEEEVFTRIVNGLYASDETRLRIIRYAENNGV